MANLEMIKLTIEDIKDETAFSHQAKFFFVSGNRII
jgi:hypothetical protein